MEILDIIKKRLSIRKYQDRKLPEETVKEIMEAARFAPSARNLMQLQYRVITNTELRQKISDSIGKSLMKEMAANPPPPGSPPMPDRPDFFYHASLLVLITGPKDNSWIESDAALAIQNIMLYAASRDLGSCFIGMAKFVERDSALLKELHIAADHKIVGSVICGYADETPAPKEKVLNAEYFK